MNKDMNEEQSVNLIKRQKYDTVSYVLLISAVFLLPIFFIPFLQLSLNFSKNAILGILVITSFIFWIIARLKTGEVAIPKSGILYALGIVTFFIFLSSLFSAVPKVSLFGYGNELDTFFSFIVFALLAFLLSISLQKKGRIRTIYRTIFASFVVVILFQLIRLIFGPEILSFGIFSRATDGIAGGLHDMAIIYAFIIVFALIALRGHAIRVSLKWSLYALIIVSFMLLIISGINFFLVWLLLSIVSLIVTIYAIFFEKRKTNEVVTEYNEYNEDNGSMTILRFVPIVPTIVFIVSLSFLFLLGVDNENIIKTKIENRTSSIGIIYREANPSWGSTVHITKEAWKVDPVFGVGPNRFSNQWITSKPGGINESIFWSFDFRSGVGVVPTFAATSGILGTIAWFLFLSVLMLTSIKILLKQTENGSPNLSLFSSFIGMIYFWLVALLYVPNITVFALAFIFTGIFIAIGAREGAIKNIHISFLNSPKLGFVAVLFMTVCVIISVTGEYVVIKRFASEVFYAKALAETESVARTEKLIGRTIGLYKTDVHYRAMSEVQILKLREILSDDSLDEDEIRTQFQNTFGNAVAYAESSTEYDSTNYMNWISLGRVYEAVVPLGVEGAYEKARSLYEKAIAINPDGPALYIDLARVALSNNDSAMAKDYINQALERKSNYTEALFLLAQIETNSGNIRGAIEPVERASLIAPNDEGIFFQLGFLKYKDRDYTGAIEALERAVSLNPVYANAKYFLGLSYDKVDRADEAVSQFEDVGYLNPDNDEVKRILENLKAGRGPFTDVAPPLELPEERDDLPIEE